MLSKKLRLLIAGACGLLAAVFLFVYASGVRAEAAGARDQALAAYGGEQIEVYVADRDIAVGEQLSPSNVSKRVWLVDLLPAGASGEESGIIGQTVRVPMLANEVVVSSKLGVSAEPFRVPEGYCALSVPSDDVRAVGGAIQPGSQVALYATNGTQAKLLVAEVQVLATSSSPALGNVASLDTGTANGTGSAYSGSARSTQQNLKWVTLAIEEERVQEIITASQNQ
ncbi:MAG: SAF domain-containing protein, partial [Coriobacteriales bacterium]|nr:SAF domain-containing protein [Coriobacteriales bacterium]